MMNIIYLVEILGLDEDYDIKWKNIITASKNFSEELVQYLSEVIPKLNFSQEVRKWIREGIECDFTLEQMKMYINPVYHHLQMREIYRGFKYGLTMEQVALYAKRELSSDQMATILYGLGRSTIEQVRIYANPKFSEDKMWIMCKGYEHGLSIEQMMVCANPEFSSEQMNKIILGFECGGFSVEQVKMYAKPEFSPEQMEKKCAEILNQIISQHLDIPIDLNFDFYQLLEIKSGFENNLTIDQIKMYAKTEFDYNQMAQIRIGFEHYLTEKQIRQYADPCLSYTEMSLLRNDIERKRDVETLIRRKIERNKKKS